VSVLSPAQGYARWAPTYGETVVTALETSVVASIDLPLAGRRVLDVGCGTASRFAPALRAGAALVAGVDLTPAMLARATDRGLLAAADVRALPIADGMFDVVWCRLVLGYVAELAAAYAELARACTPGGVVLVTDFHPAAAAAGHRRTFRDADGELHEVENHVHDVPAHRLGAARAGLALRDLRDRVVSDTVRDFYEQAGRLDMYERQLGLPLVLALVFTREE
jgi:malonyl-CoA O-methyltransferase